MSFDPYDKIPTTTATPRPSIVERSEDPQLHDTLVNPNSEILLECDLDPPEQLQDSSGGAIRASADVHPPNPPFESEDYLVRSHMPSPTESIAPVTENTSTTREPSTEQQHLQELPDGVTTPIQEDVNIPSASSRQWKIDNETIETASTGSTSDLQPDSSNDRATLNDGVDTSHVEEVIGEKVHSTKDELNGCTVSPRTPLLDWLTQSDFAYDPMEASEAEALGYPRLDFKPLAMRTWFLAVTAAFFLACVVVMMFVLIMARKHGWVIHVNAHEVYLAYRYVPVALGSITTIWWRTVTTTYGRLHPYLLMSAKRADRGKMERRLQAYYPLGIFEPALFDLPALVLTGRWLLASCMLLNFGNALYLMPLKASLIGVTPSGRGWDVAIASNTGYVLLSTYALLVLLALAILATLYGTHTGLKWDPVSVADQLCLIQGSNMHLLLDNLEIADTKDFLQMVKKRGQHVGPLRLGYWKHRRNGSVWHGMAFATVDTGDVPHPKSRDTDVRQLKGRACDLETIAETSHAPPILHEPSEDDIMARYRTVLGMLCDPSLALYATVTLSALGYMASGVVRGYLRSGIPLHLAAAKSLTGQYPSEQFVAYTLSTRESFIYLFLPVFLMGCFNFLWSNADDFYRHMSSFAGMYTPTAATSNILLDYPNCLPFEVTVKAALNSHWRVALFSLLALIGTLPPIVVSGIFVATGDKSESVVRLQPVNFWATFAILIVYLICIGFARPSVAYRFPRCIWNIADLALYCYRSQILTDKLLEAPVFSAQDQGDERIHMISRIYLAKKEYLFGMYLGSDGKRHMGFDVYERQTPTGQVALVNTFDPGSCVYLTPWGYRYYFRGSKARNESEI